MSEETVIYTELKLTSSRQHKDKRRSMVQWRGYPWHIVALILGIICFFFLLTIISLGYMVSHRCSGDTRHDMKETEEKNVSLPEVEDQLILPSPTAWNEDDDIFQGQWYCCGKSCYHFSTEKKTWEESKTSCEALNSSLVKIDNKREQIFIQSKVRYNYWIGLVKVERDMHPWRWLDGSPVSKNLIFHPSVSPMKCGCLKSSSIYNADCSKNFPYICEREFTGPDN